MIVSCVLPPFRMSSPPPLAALFPGFKNKVLNYVQEHPEVNTGSLCAQFKILFYHKKFVLHVADQFGMKDTVKDWPAQQYDDDLNSNAAPSIQEVQAPPAPSPMSPTKSAESDSHSPPPLKRNHAVANLHSDDDGALPTETEMMSNAVATSEAPPAKKQQLSPAERFALLEEKVNSMAPVLDYADSAARRFWALMKNEELHKLVPSFFQTDRAENAAFERIRDRSKFVAQQQQQFKGRAQAREVARSALSAVEAQHPSNFSGVHSKLRQMNYWEGVLDGLNDSKKAFAVPLLDKPDI